jgi:hypothetical protein
VTVTLTEEPPPGGAGPRLVDAKEVGARPDEAATVVFSLPGTARGQHRVAIELEGGAGDALPLDDSATFTIAPPEKQEALLVTPGNYFLERLLAVDARISARKIGPAELAATPIGPDEVAIFDRAPPAELPPGGAIFVGCLPPGRKPAHETPVKDATVAEWDALHPTTRFSTFGELAIAEATPIALGPQDRAILSSTRGPLIAEVREGRARAIVVCFDLMKSDWPLKASFPIFLRSALRYVAGRSRGERAAIRVGDPIEVEGAARDGEVSITDPAGAVRKLRADGLGRATLAETRLAGRYLVDPGGRPPFAVFANLLDARETAIAPLEKLDLGERPVETVRASVVSPRPLWRAFAIAALALVLLEWWVYHRRAYL